jgi:16S rRNA (guanine(527)-N(7))-methyltransferase RsmG
VFRELVLRCAALSMEQAAALERHYELLCKWNKALNLTTIRRLEDVVERHYCESLFLAERLGTGSVADIGSGAGFPGFVVAVARPDCSVTLIESHQRTAVFQKESARNLPNVRVIPKRAEDINETFDWVVSRAVSYSDLSPIVPRLGKRFALLTGSEEPPLEWGLDWDTFLLPNGDQRFLRVSRETAG